MIYHIYIMYCVQYKVEGECPFYQPKACDFTKYFYLQCYLVIIETLCTTKSVIYEIVWAKNVETVFTLKQINFSFPAQTAVVSNINCLGEVLLLLTWVSLLNPNQIMSQSDPSLYSG